MAKIKDSLPSFQYFRWDVVHHTPFFSEPVYRTAPDLVILRYKYSLPENGYLLDDGYAIVRIRQDGTFSFSQNMGAMALGVFDTLEQAKAKYATLDHIPEEVQRRLLFNSKSANVNRFSGCYLVHIGTSTPLFIKNFYEACRDARLTIAEMYAVCRDTKNIVNGWQMVSTGSLYHYVGHIPKEVVDKFREEHGF